MFTLGDANAIYKKATLYVPQGSEGDYAIAEGWKNFAGIEVFQLGTGVETIHLDAPIQKSKVYYNLRCQRPCCSAEVHQHHRWQEGSGEVIPFLLQILNSGTSHSNRMDLCRLFIKFFSALPRAGRAGRSWSAWCRTRTAGRWGLCPVWRMTSCTYHSLAGLLTLTDSLIY